MVRSVVMVSALFAAGCGWWGDGRAAVRRHLDACTDMVNAPLPQGLGGVARAAQIGRCFTEDASVDLGGGTAPIAGRETIIGMIARLQPRTSEYRLDLADVRVHVAPDGKTADVDLTAEFIRRQPESRQTMDAREFRLSMAREEGEWKIAKVVGVQTLR